MINVIFLFKSDPFSIMFLFLDSSKTALHDSKIILPSLILGLGAPRQPILCLNQAAVVAPPLTQFNPILFKISMEQNLNMKSRTQANQGQTNIPPSEKLLMTTKNRHRLRTYMHTQGTGKR